MEHVGEVLSAALKTSGMRKKFMTYHCLLHWPEIVGADIALHTRPGLMQGRMLFVTVDNSVWCHHLTMMKEDIIRKINHFASQAFSGEKILDNIRFQAGDLRNNQNEMKVEDDTERVQPVMVTGQETATARELVKEVKDVKLKNKLTRIISTDIARRKYRQLSHWQSCKRCDVLCSSNETYCSACKVLIGRERELAIRKLLLDIPWIGYEECNSYQPCSKEEFGKAKNRLIEKMAYAIYLGQPNSLQIATLVMLTQSCKPEGISTEMQEYVVKKYSRRQKNVFTPRS